MAQLIYRAIIITSIYQRGAGRLTHERNKLSASDEITEIARTTDDSQHPGHSIEHNALESGSLLVYCDLTYWCYMNPVDQLTEAGDNVAIVFSRFITQNTVTIMSGKIDDREKLPLHEINMVQVVG